MSDTRTEYPTLLRIQREANFDPFDDEPTDFARLERYIELLEAQVRAFDMLGGRDEVPVSTGSDGEDR